MWVIFYVIFNLMFHTTELERTKIALDVLNKAYPDWSEQYVINEFDCSEMSAFVDEYLDFWGVNAKPISKIDWNTGVAHRWLEVDGIIIECTKLKIIYSSSYYDRFTSFLFTDNEEEFDWYNVDYIKGYK